MKEDENQYRVHLADQTEGFVAKHRPTFTWDFICLPGVHACLRPKWQTGGPTNQVQYGPTLANHSQTWYDNVPSRVKQ